MRHLSLILIFVLSPVCMRGVEGNTPITPFLRTYCIECHGSKKQKGDRRFDKLTGDFTNLEEAEVFQEILDQLNLAQMPPEGKKHPPVAELKEVVEQLTQSLAYARKVAHENSGKVVLRRLNRAEYLNLSLIHILTLPTIYSV